MLWLACAAVLLTLTSADDSTRHACVSPRPHTAIAAWIAPAGSGSGANWSVSASWSAKRTPCANETVFFPSQKNNKTYSVSLDKSVDVARFAGESALGRSLKF